MTPSGAARHLLAVLAVAGAAATAAQEPEPGVIPVDAPPAEVVP